VRKPLLAAAIIGGCLLAVPTTAASASPLPASGAMVPASGSPPRAVTVSVRTPTLPTHRVVSGDSLWSIGVRYHRGWPALAAFNHIPNADLIFVGQVLTIPPASYVGSYTVPTPLRVSTPVHTQVIHAPAKQQVSTPVQHVWTSYAPSGGTGSGSFTGVWACIAQHESGGNPSTNTGNGYYGGLQFTQGTWQANGGSGNPASASAAEQQRVAENVVRASGGSYGAWPNTSRMCGV
jgi:LysM repeat protein